MSHLLLLFLGICSSDHAGRTPGARTQIKLPIEIVAENRRTSSHVCTQPQTHALRSGFEPGTNVGAGCSCHPTGWEYHRSARVPLHPVWPRWPVARFTGLIPPSKQRSSGRLIVKLCLDSCGLHGTEANRTRSSCRFLQDGLSVAAATSHLESACSPRAESEAGLPPSQLPPSPRKTLGDR